MDKARAKLTILTALQQGMTVAQAAKEAGVPRRTIYDWRDQDRAFRAEWEYAIDSFREQLLGEGWAELKARAFDKSDVKSHIMLIFMLKRLDPEFKENYRTNKTVVHQQAVDIEFSDDEWKEAMETLRKHQPKDARPAAPLEGGEGEI